MLRKDQRSFRQAKYLFGPGNSPGVGFSCFWSFLMSKPLYRVKTRFIPSKKSGAKAHEGKTRADIIRTTDNE